MKYLFIQFSNSMFQRHQQNDLYWQKFYKKYESFGYVKGNDSFEIPKWIAQIKFLLKDNCKLLWCRHNINQVIDYLNKYHPEYVFFSVMNCNIDFVDNIINSYNKCQYIIGGYVQDIYTKWNKFNNVKSFHTIKQFSEYFNIDYQYGTDYSLFNGIQTIPRLTLSLGCKNNCKFCIINHNLIELQEKDIFNQIDSFKNLKFKLIYIDDKTFGQAKNFNLLKKIKKYILTFNQQFIGFIIQTTSTMLIQKIEQFIENDVIVSEIGLQTFNNDILKKYNKPSSQEKIIQAINISNKYNMNIICNVIIGFPQETQKSYNRTLNFIKKNIITGYNLSIYTDYSDKNNFGQIDFMNDNKKQFHKKWWDIINKESINSMEKYKWK